MSSPILNVPISSPISTGEQTVNGSVDIIGNLSVTGILDAHIVADLIVTDKVITLNHSVSGAGISGDGLSGITVERGSLPDTSIVFNEATDGWELHFEGSANQTLATRSSDVASGAIPFGNIVNGYTHNDSQLHWKNTAGSYYLGIGTNDPQASLHLKRAGGATLRLENDADAPDNVVIYVSAGTSDASIGTHGAHPLRFFVNSNSYMQLGTNGFLGIGNVAPDTRLHISQSSDLNIAKFEGFCTTIQMKAFTGGAYIGTLYTPVGESDDTLYLGTNGNTSITMLSGGNVGIGTITPSQKLEVNGNIKATSIIFPNGDSISGAPSITVSTTGTFTPALSFVTGQTGSFTYGTRTGTWTKVGNLITCFVDITWTAKPSAGNSLLLTLPYQATSNGTINTPLSLTNDGTWTGTSPQTGYIAAGTSICSFHSLSTSNPNSYNAADIPTNAQLIFSFSYTV